MAAVRKRVLVVDDDHECRLMISSLMGRAGYTVDAVADGEMALSLLRNNVPDVVVLDAHLPLRNGFDVCRLIKANPSTAKTPVIMLSAFSADGARQLSLDAGADEYIEKPFRREQLLEVLEHLIAVQAQFDPGEQALVEAVSGGDKHS